MTDKYNSTTLTQVFANYFQEHSIGDVGGADNNYSPIPGYIGTLAPGEHFQDVNPIDTLPKQVLHPWPALQEVPFHVRWPVSHPLSFGPLMLLAMNDMFLEVK
jgi:hypothetical protein